MNDDDILTLLQTLHRPIFFTRDPGFYARENLNPRYAIVCLAVGKYEVATFVRRILALRARRMQSFLVGKIASAGHTGMRFLQFRGTERPIIWKTKLI